MWDSDAHGTGAGGGGDVFVCSVRPSALQTHPPSRRCLPPGADLACIISCTISLITLGVWPLELVRLSAHFLTLVGSRVPKEIWSINDSHPSHNSLRRLALTASRGAQVTSVGVGLVSRTLLSAPPLCLSRLFTSCTAPRWIRPSSQAARSADSPLVPLPPHPPPILSLRGLRASRSTRRAAGTWAR